jgi:hypothetical protein
MMSGMMSATQHQSMKRFSLASALVAVTLQANFLTFCYFMYFLLIGRDIEEVLNELKSRKYFE